MLTATNDNLQKHINLPMVNYEEIASGRGEGSWEEKIISNDLYKVVLVHHVSGEENKLHYHQNADETWVILNGEWKWYLEGVVSKKARRGNIVYIKKGTRHKIKCLNNNGGLRLAIIKSDASHIFV